MDKALYLIKFIHQKKAEKKNILILQNSPFMNEKWYFTTYPEAKGKAKNAAEHYLKYGWKEGKKPCATFDGNAYLRLNPDVAKAKINPLLHYEKSGKEEGRSWLNLPETSSQKETKIPVDENYQLILKSTFFDKKWYLAQNPDVAAAGLDPIKHYLTVGWKENRLCTPVFDGKAYLRLNPDVARAKMNPLLHYEKHGKKEGRTWVEKEEKPLCAINHFFSVIVASYNYQDYIKKTLDSLVNQTYTNFEVIVVDDGSTDNSVKVIKKYVKKYSFIHLYQHKKGENKGLPETVYLGLTKSKGEYIAFCESDDYWDPAHLEAVNNKINSGKNVQIIVNDVETFGNKERCFDMAKVIYHRKQEIISQNGLISDEKFTLSNYILTFSACCVASSLLRTCNFLDVPKKTALDWWLWRQICYQNRIYFIDKKLTYWRLHLSYNIRDIKGEEQKHTEFVDKLNKIMEKRKYNSIYQNNGKLTDIDDFQILESKANRKRLIERIKKGDWKNIKVCYISTTQQVRRPIGDGSVRYRCYHPAEALSAQGAFVTITPHTNFLNALSYYYDIYIFHRPCKAETNIIRILKNLGKIVIADYDDLIFGNQEAAIQSSLYKNSKLPLKQITAAFQCNLEALLEFNFVSVSTEGLKKEVLNVHPHAKVFVVHNFIPESIMNISQKIQARNQPKDKNLLMYCTGTLSHNLDFESIEDVLLSCLEKDKNLKLLIFGVLTASEKLQKTNRVFFHNVVDYWHLFNSMSATAFTLAPLEMPSRFNNCKSNVKFLESSVAGATLFATPIEDMTRIRKAAITLCSTPQEWENAVLSRHQINIQENIKHNFDYVLNNCSTVTFMNEIKNIFNHTEF